MTKLLNCRTCLEGIGKDIPKYSIIKNENIRKMLAACADIHVEIDPHYPEDICQTCYQELQIAYRFKSRAEMCEEEYFSKIKDSKDMPIIVWTEDEISTLNENKSSHYVGKSILETNELFYNISVLR